MDQCNQLMSAAFESHVKCYIDCGFCQICKTNKLALIAAYQFNDFLSIRAIRQVKRTLMKCDNGIFSCLW